MKRCSLAVEVSAGLGDCGEDAGCRGEGLGVVREDRGLRGDSEARRWAAQLGGYGSGDPGAAAPAHHGPPLEQRGYGRPSLPLLCLFPFLKLRLSRSPGSPAPLILSLLVCRGADEVDPQRRQEDDGRAALRDHRG